MWHELEEYLRAKGNQLELVEGIKHFGLLSTEPELHVNAGNTLVTYM